MKQEFYLDRLKGMLDHDKYIHSLGVRDAAVQLARIHGADARQAALAGLLHDCARCMPADRLLELAGRFNLPVHEVDLALPVLLHAPVGARLARQEFGVEDEAVLRAIALHTLGDVGMDLLDKVVFVADKVEPGRCYADAERLREMARHDLDRALLACFDMSVSYALRLGDPVHPGMIEARNRLIFSVSGEKFNYREGTLNRWANKNKE